MKISKGDNYLRLSELVEGVVYERVALVTSTSAGLAKTNTGFVKFFLKDIDANVVVAFLFDVAQFTFAGLQLAAFKGKPVILRFVPQIYNGKISLIIDAEYGIKEWTGDFDRKQFIGEIKFNEKIINKFGQSVFGSDWELPIEYTTISIDSIAGGKSGGLCKVLELVILQLKGYQSLVLDEWKLLCRSTLIAFDVLFSCERARQNAGVLEDVKIFDIILIAINKYREDPYYGVLLDVTRAISGEAPPKHLISHLIVDSVNQAKNSINLISTYNSMIVGATTDVGGALLSKF